MRAHPIRRMNCFVIEAIQINRIGAVDRDATAIDEPRDRIDHSKILILVIAAEGGWKNNERKSALAERQHLEITAQMGCPPADVTLLHAEKGNRKASIIRQGNTAKRETGASAVDNESLFADSSCSQNVRAHSHRKYSTTFAA